MSQSLVTSTVAEGHDALALENGRIRAVVIPSLGGRVWTLDDMVRSRQWIWHRQGVPLTQCAPGAVYDDVWAGGWEELFPNDAPGLFEGRTLPDHGEWWTLKWDAEASADESGARVLLRSRTTIIQAECEKEFFLAADAPELRVSYRIRSHERTPFHFLFKQHLPLDVTPSCRLVLPGGMVTAVASTFGNLLAADGPVEWPAAGRGDLHQVRAAQTATREFVYVRDLPASWCGVDDVAAAASLRMRFDEAMPYVWLFITYGGWRDLHTAVLEPCTNMPKELPDAVRLGQSAVLNPGAVFETTVHLRVSGLGAAA